MEHFSETAKHILDTVSIAAAFAALAQWLPPMAALLSIVWTSLRIFEWFESRLKKKRKG